MAYNFPNTPAPGDIFTPPGGSSYRWNGFGWEQLAAESSGVEEAPLDGINYVRKNAAWVTLPITPADWATITGKPSTLPPSAHTHTTAEITGLDAAQSAQDTTITGKVGKAGDTMTGALELAPPSGNPLIRFNKPTSGNANVISGQKGGLGRWDLLLGDTSAEGGGNTGSALTINRIDDAGNYIDQPLVISRSSGNIALNNLTRVLTTGDVELSGSNPSVWMTAPTGHSANLRFERGVLGPRWIWQMTGAAESGANVGSDLNLYRYDDAGLNPAATIGIIRSTGAVNVPKLTSTTQTAGTNTTDVATTAFVTTANALNEKLANKGVANGYAPLDGTIKIASSYLPSYVDDVLEYANLAAFPGTGTAGVIYVALDTNKTYRWGGSSYTEISPSPGSTDAVPEGSVNLYYTDARVAAAPGVTAKVAKAGDTMTGKLTVPASTTAGAGFTIGNGASPTTPADGDLWAVGGILVLRAASTNISLMNNVHDQTMFGIKTFGGKTIMRTPVAGAASITLPHGVAPTTPVNGDMWTTTAGLFIYINGVVKTVTLT